MGKASKELPSEWIQALFRRLQAIYGNRTAVMWGDVDPVEVKTVWGAELGGFEGEDLRVAIDQLRHVCPEYPPTLWQFSRLCRDAQQRRRGNQPKLEAPRVPMPARIREQLRAFVSEHRFGAKRSPGTMEDAKLRALKAIERVQRGLQ